MLKTTFRVMKNTSWKTTIFGSAATIFAALIPVFPQYTAALTAAGAICGVLFASFTKDYDKTGLPGQSQNTDTQTDIKANVLDNVKKN